MKERPAKNRANKVTNDPADSGRPGLTEIALGALAASLRKHNPGVIKASSPAATFESRIFHRF